MARISHGRSWKMKEERGDAAAASNIPSVKRRSIETILSWLSAFALATLSGYSLQNADISTDTLWTNSLFSEYFPPIHVHLHLLHQRNISLLMNQSEPSGLWDDPATKGWKSCLKRSEKLTFHGNNNGYLQIFCSGGIFQLHICVCNAVAVARLLNSTLLIPDFRYNSFWKDPSKFQDIYDIDHFTLYLKNDINIVRELPPPYGWSTPEFYDRRCLERPNCLTFIPKHASKDWYLENVLPILISKGLAVLDSFNHKLTFEGLPLDITRLRCKTNFHALRFIKPILDLGQKLVKQMQAKALVLQRSVIIKASSNATTPVELHASNGFNKISNKTEAGRFIGLHLRFEKDMIAHSACYYGGGRAEQRSLAAFRRNVFKSRVPKALFDSEDLRRNGSCPLTSEEVGLLLSGLGFRNWTPFYLAGKELYGGKARLQPLRNMFPYLENKFSLASQEELKEFLPFSHKLAALDFTVLLSSHVFISNAAGNFPNVLSGYRAYFGPRKSIHPDKAGLVSLFSNSSLKWNDFAASVVSMHKNRLGEPCPRRERYSVFRYPAPDCMCFDKKGLL